jgi:hypothetical protein
MSISTFFVAISSAVTLEPAIFLSTFGRWMVEGNAMNVDMIMEKLCLDEVGAEGHVCANLAEYPGRKGAIKINNIESQCLDLIVVYCVSES